MACPTCSRSLMRRDGTLAVSCCGRTFERYGGVWNFVGDATHIFSRARDKTVSSLLVASKPELELALTRLHADADDALAAESGISNAEVLGLEKALPLKQILNNVDDYRQDLRKLSPTIAFMKANLDVNASSRILDAGCSTGRHLLEFALSGAEMTGVDFRAFGLYVGDKLWPTNLAPKPTFCAASVTNLPFLTASFTHVMSSVVIGLTPVQRTMSEFARVLDNGGKLVLTVEGPGFLQETWDTTPLWSRQKLGLLRWWLGAKLMVLGIDWQARSWSRNLSSLTQYSPETLSSFAREAGFEIEKTCVLTDYRGKPRLIGIVARKPNA